jgi:hypothetical protein
MTTSAHQQEDQQKKKKALPFDYTTTDDIFLNTKGKALRNKQKTLDKIFDTEKQIKKSEIVPTDAQKEMVARKDALKAEMKEIKELIDLYIQSNPDYKRKGVEETKVEEVPVPVVNTHSLEAAFKLMADVLLLKSFNNVHSGVISHAGSELCCFQTLTGHITKLHSSIASLDL